MSTFFGYPGVMIRLVPILLIAVGLAFAATVFAAAQTPATEAPLAACVIGDELGNQQMPKSLERCGKFSSFGLLAAPCQVEKALERTASEIFPRLSCGAAEPPVLAGAREVILLIDIPPPKA
ncbi:MAG: hypothetical protein CML24_11290 [Rhizobiales bacterium]|nr:hypothetical protein [Hyphomicrobiales bacterium]|tara:strand:- start:4556 stop:4921 length:366 start_codon:yes stop_codon:yes gene_type:complete